MPAISLRKYIEVEYPLTSKSTYTYWANQALYQGRGPLAGKVKRVGGRWYIELNRDKVVSGIVEDIKSQIDTY